MRRRRLVLAVVVPSVVLGGALLLLLARRERTPAFGPLVVSPGVERLSMRVGDRVHFSAKAAGAERVLWSIWGRPRLAGSSFTFVPGPRDAGWQQVSVEVWGRAGARVTRTWDVGVVPAVPPELTELVPAPGAVRLEAGAEARFRCAARVPAARADDRVRFEWTIDGQPIRRDERPADDAVSELALPSPEPGVHRVTLRVSEDGRVAARAEWTVEIPEATEGTLVAVLPPPPPVPPSTVPPPGPPATNPPTTNPPTTTPPPQSPSPTTTSTVPQRAAVAPPELPPPRLVRAPGPRRLEAAVGERVVLRVALAPESAPARFEWTVDGRRVRGAQKELRYEARTPGTHRVGVHVSAAGRTVGRDAWTIVVPPPPVARAPEPAAPPRPAVAAVPSRPPAALDEAQIRRWLDEYARAWSRKDTAALRRMGQVRSAAEVRQLERYFESVKDLEVRVRVRAVRVDGGRASVEFERIDTVTDPTGRRQELTSPPVRKEIERTPDGLRFVSRGKG